MRGRELPPSPSNLDPMTTYEQRPVPSDFLMEQLDASVGLNGHPPLPRRGNDTPKSAAPRPQQTPSDDAERTASQEAGHSPEQADPPVQQAAFSPDAHDIGRETLTCAAINKRGKRCRARPMRNAGHCVFHNPDTAQLQRRNQSAGGQASGLSRRASAKDIHVNALSLVDRRSTQALLDAVIRLELTGRLAPTRTRNILRAISIAVRNFDPETVNIGYYQPDYNFVREALDDFLEDACASADSHDAARQAQSIANAASLKRAVNESDETSTGSAGLSLKEDLLAQSPFPPSPLELVPAPSEHPTEDDSA